MRRDVNAMKVTKIKGEVASLLIVGLTVGAGICGAQEKKQEALKVKLDELANEPERFKGKLVQVDGVIEETQILKEKQGEYTYRLVVGKNDALLVWCVGD